MEVEACIRRLAERMGGCAAAVPNIATAAHNLTVISDDIRRITTESADARQTAERLLKGALSALEASIGHCPPAFSRCTMADLATWSWKGVHRVPYTPSLRDHDMWGPDMAPVPCSLMMPARTQGPLPLWMQDEDDTVRGVWLLTLVAVGDDDDTVPAAAVDAYARACNTGMWGSLFPLQCVMAPVCSDVRIMATLHPTHEDIGVEAWMASATAHIHDVVRVVPLCCRMHTVRAKDAQAGAELAERAACVFSHDAFEGGPIFHLGRDHGCPGNILLAGARPSAVLMRALCETPPPMDANGPYWEGSDAVVITTRGMGPFHEGTHIVRPSVEPILDDSIYAKYGAFFSCPPVARCAHFLDGDTNQPPATIYSCARSVSSCMGANPGIRACVTAVQAVMLVMGIYDCAGSEEEAIKVLGPLPQTFLKAVAPARVGSGAAMLMAIDVRLLEVEPRSGPTVAQAASGHDSVLSAAIACIMAESSAPAGRPVDIVEEALAQLHHAHLLRVPVIRALLALADDCCVMPVPPVWDPAASVGPGEGSILGNTCTWTSSRYIVQALSDARFEPRILEDLSSHIATANVIAAPTLTPGCPVETFVQDLNCEDEAAHVSAVRGAVDKFLSEYLDAITMPDLTEDGCGYIFSQACQRALLLVPPRDRNFIKAMSHNTSVANRSAASSELMPDAPSYGAGVAADVLDNFIGALNWLAARQASPGSYLNGIGLSRQHHTAAVLAVVYARLMGVRRPLARQALRFVAPSCATQGFLVAVENEMFGRPWTVDELEGGGGLRLANALGSHFAAQGGSRLCLVDSAAISARLFGRNDLSCTEQLFFADWRECEGTPQLLTRIVCKHRGLTPDAAAAIGNDITEACDRRALCKFVTGKALSGAERITISLREFSAVTSLPSAATCVTRLYILDYWAEVNAGRQSRAWLVERLRHDLGLTLSLAGPGFSLA